ncbi:MAG: spore coat associated protein CotJA [Ruminococcus sp.]|nr:spore coat associated protein CotJA [Ruminococcus sp.]MCD7810922.1 spore coat associated protein CotJA [Ruminococcus sp.]
MNFNLFDDMDGLILRERENSLNRQNAYSKSSMTDNNASSGGYDGNMPRFPKNTPLAMSYVPFQQWGEVYSEDEAFSSGTLFPQLDFPFEIGGGMNE